MTSVEDTTRGCMYYDVWKESFNVNIRLFYVVWLSLLYRHWPTIWYNVNIQCEVVHVRTCRIKVSVNTLNTRLFYVVWLSLLHRYNSTRLKIFLTKQSNWLLHKCVEDGMRGYVCQAIWNEGFNMDICLSYVVWPSLLYRHWPIIWYNVNIQCEIVHVRTCRIKVSVNTLNTRLFYMVWLSLLHCYTDLSIFSN